MFVDEARIYVAAGRGGDGAVAFRREKFVPRGGPAGGDGGKGGDVIFVVDAGLNTLMDFRHQTHYRAANGDAGGGTNKTGANGRDLVVRVPPGTLVWAEEGFMIADLTEPNQKVVVARGGRGGKGNARFASSTHRVPRMAERGQPGEARWLRLELSLLADVGLVGFPNAGKSTLISRFSAARPRIADYPFTTLDPHLGVVDHYGDPFVVADVPGLIAGAHTGAGLGHEFLRHLQRTRILVHVLDCSPATGRDPVADYRVVRHELEAFSPSLASRPEIVAANKMDLVEAREALMRIQQTLGVSVYPVSGISGEGLEALGYAMRALLDQTPPMTDDRPPMVIRPKVSGFRLESEPDGSVRIVGDIEDRAVMTQWGNPEAEDYFIEYLNRRGIFAALRKGGAVDGQTIKLGPGELLWYEGHLVRPEEADRIKKGQRDK